jgi:hypothetical protein
MDRRVGKLVGMKEGRREACVLGKEKRFDQKRLGDAGERGDPPEIDGHQVRKR